MLINEVISIVGLSRKSIRYYESVGLLTPSRNSNNDYRLYTDEDIKKLKVIKFLRELDVSIKELQLLDKGKLTLKECLLDRVDKISKEEEKYKKVKDMCNEIVKSNDNYNDIDIDKYFLEINKLNKEGFTIRNVKTNHTKKVVGAILSSMIFIIIFLSIIALISYFEFIEGDSIPIIYFGLIVLILLLPVISIVINLIKRIKEIVGGEEDEASKY